MPEQGQGREVVKLLGLASAVGLGAGLAAVAYLAVEHGLDHIVWTSVPEQFGWSEPAAWWVALVLLAGSLGVYAASKLPGHGGHSPLDGFKLDIGPAHIASALLAAMASLVAGAVLGPEAPLMAAGTAVGAAFAARATPEVRRLAMVCGAAAAMGMIFGNPLITVILLLEAAVVKGAKAERRPSWRSCRSCSPSDSGTRYRSASPTCPASDPTHWRSPDSPPTPPWRWGTSSQPYPRR